MITENVILVIGIALTLGFVIGKITHHLRLTAIVGYIVVGILLGPTFHVVELSSYETNLIVSFTLGLIGFIIGGSFTLEFLTEARKTKHCNYNNRILHNLLNYYLRSISFHSRLDCGFAFGFDRSGNCACGCDSIFARL